MVHAAWARNTICRLSLIGRCQGQTIVNVFHFEATTVHEATLGSDVVAQTSGATLATDWNTNLKTAYLAQLSSDYTLQTIRSQIVERPGQTDHILLATDNVTGLPGAGTSGAASDDMSTAVVIKWKSVLAGRHSRGRTYIGPVQEIISAAGLVSSATPFTAFKDAMITRYTGLGAGVVAGWNFTVYSRPYNAPHGAYTVRVPGSGLTVVNNTTDYDGDSNFITSGKVDTILRTQRRRQIGVGS